MPNADDVVIASQQHHEAYNPKALDAEGYGTGKWLSDDEISNSTCQHFSIRGYVAKICKLDRNMCWPFPQQLLETRLKEAGNLALPPLEIPCYRWWNCENCLGDIGASAERPVEKKNEKQKENILDYTVGLTVENSGDPLENSGHVAGSTAYELTDQEKKDEDMIVTDVITKNGRFQCTVSMEIENEKSGIIDSVEKSTGISCCFSNSRNSEGIINMTETYRHFQDPKLACAEMGQPVMETIMTSILVNKTKELSSKQNKCEETQIVCQASNSWENFSWNKNGFKEISEKMKGKEMEPASCPVLGSEFVLDAKKVKNMGNVSVSVTCAENVEAGQQVVGEGKNEKTMSKVIESLTLKTMEFSIQNKVDSHRHSDGRNDALYLNGSESSCSKKVKECNDLSTSQGSLEKENMLLLEQTEKLKVGEWRSKRRPQKKRSIADIIASKPSRLESWNEEKEESKCADIMEEKMTRTDNNEQSPRSEEDHMEASTEAVEMSSNPTIEAADICEVNVDAEMDIALLKKRRAKKLTGRKKQPGIAVHSLDACSTLAATNSLTSSLSEATHAFQMPQGSSPLVSATRDKAPEDNFLHPECGQSGQRFSEMEDEIPMDIVELMAKNQHERGLSNLNRLHESHKTKKGVEKLKMNETVHRHINNCVEGGGRPKKDTASGAQLKKTGKSNLETSLRNHCQSDILIDYGQIDVCQAARDISFISNKEGIKSGSSKVDLPMLQSTQWFNPWQKYSPDFLPPILAETITAYNLPYPVGGTRSHVAVTDSNQYRSLSTNGLALHSMHLGEYGSLSTNGMVLDSMQLGRASSYCGYMEMQNLCRNGTSAFSDFTGSVLPISQNKTMSSLTHNGSLYQNLTNAGSSRNLTSESADLGNAGKTFYVISESLNGNEIPNLSGRTDGASRPLYFNGQSNSALLQHVNAQARQPFGNNYCFPSVPMLRLMGQSVSVPAKSGNGKSMATENGDNRNFSSLSQVSSQKHASWFHLATSSSSGVMERNQKETFTGSERVFPGSEPLEDSKRRNEKIMGSIKPIPPVPKFWSSGQYVSTGHSGISTCSFAVSGKANVAQESCILRPKPPFRDALLSGKKQKGLQNMDGYNDNLQTFSTVPPGSQNTKLVKGSSSSKSLRSYRPTARVMHFKRDHKSAFDNYIEDRHHCLQYPWLLGSNPKQKLTNEEEKSKALNLNEVNDKSSSCRKKACNVEICTLNQNPAEINSDDDGDVYSFGYQNFASADRTLAHSERKRNMTIPQGQKRRRTLKKKHLQEFLGQNHGFVGDLLKTKVSTWNICSSK
eukprot:PITA_08189